MIEKRFLKENKVDKEMKESIVKILKKYLSVVEGVIFAYLHGSFMEDGGFKDIDIALFMKEPIEVLKVESDISCDLKEKTGYPVDVKVINNASVAFQMAVLKKGIVLLSRSEDVRIDFVEEVSRKYREYVHFRNIVLGA